MKIKTSLREEIARLMGLELTGDISRKKLMDGLVSLFEQYADELRKENKELKDEILAIGELED